MLEESINLAILVSGLANGALWALVFFFFTIKLALPIYHPFFLYLIYHFLGFVVRPLSIATLGASFLWDRIGFAPVVGDIVRISLISNLALLAMTFGMLMTSRTQDGRLAILPPLELELKIGRNFIVAATLLAVGGIYASYKSISGAGMDSVLAYEVEVIGDGGQALVGISGYVTAMAEFLPMLCIFLYFSPQTRRFAYALIIVYVGMRLFAGAQRLSFVVVLIAIFFHRLTVKGLRYPGIALMAGAFIVALVFEVVGNDRYAFRKIAGGTASMEEIWRDYRENRGSNALTSDIVEYDVATAATSYIAEYKDYSYGTQYLRILIWPIPRQLWADKPVFTSIVDLNDYGDFRYLTTSLYADSYMNIGLPSMLIVLFILGYSVGYVYEMARTTSATVAYLFFWVFLIYEKTILRDGGVTFVYFWIFSMLPLIILAISSNAKLRRVA